MGKTSSALWCYHKTMMEYYMSWIILLKVRWKK